MHTRCVGSPATLLAAALVFVWASAVGLAASNPPPRPDATAPAAPAGKSAAAQQPAVYVGDETCSTCHDGEKKSLSLTQHGKAQNTRTPAAKSGQSCETCHGPGQKHVDSGKKEDIRRFDSLNPRVANETCLSCHNKASHAKWQGGMHEARSVSCVTCHSVHAPKSERAQLKQATARDMCESCHKQEAMKVKRSGHMPVREGKMDCVTCHSPHGSNNVRMLKVGNSLNEACQYCHAEKRGPFVWDHAAGRENCASCHDPHGSNNDRMLVAKEPMLCQRCHVSSRHPATIYDGTQIAAASNRAIGRSCVNCHSQIHGSNHPAGDRFLR